MSKILVVGKPNSGKSLLFNRLTGVNQKVSNFPGVTVELKSASFRKHQLIDFPGTYSLNPITKDEQVAVEKFLEMIATQDVKGVLCMLDSTRLERSLVFALQAQELALNENIPVAFALNMMDDIDRLGESVDVTGLAGDLNGKVFPISTRVQSGLEELANGLDEMVADPGSFLPDKKTGSDIDPLRRAHELHQVYGPSVDKLLSSQNRLDKFFLSGLTGGFAFVVIMMLLFQSIFTWAIPLMDGVESGVGWLSQMVTGNMAPGRQ